MLPLCSNALSLVNGIVFIFIIVIHLIFEVDVLFRYHYPDMDKAQCKTSAALGKYMTCYIYIFPCKNILNLVGNRTSSCLKSRLDPVHVNSFSIRIHKETKDLGDRDVRTSKFSFEDMTAKRVL